MKYMMIACVAAVVVLGCGAEEAARRIEIFTANMKDKYVDEFLSIVDDTNAVPVLVHCQHGADRTGTMCAM